MPPVHALTVLADARLESDLARYGSEAEMIVLPAANPGHVQPTDFDQADRLIGAALQAARTVLSRVAVPSRAAS